MSEGQGPIDQGHFPSWLLLTGPYVSQ